MHETELQQRLTEIDERIDRVSKRFTAGYGTDSDREGWLAWLQALQTRRAVILAELAAVEANSPSAR